MERWVAKVIAIIISFVLPFFFMMLPCAIHTYISSKGKTGKRVISYLMCFGGGIFFGTYLLHMSPEVREILSVNLLDPNDIAYPVTDLIIGAGFFFVLFLEKIIMRINKRSNERKVRKLQEHCDIYKNAIQEGNTTKAQVCQNCFEKKPCEAQTVKEIEEAAPAYTVMATDMQEICIEFVKTGRKFENCMENKQCGAGNNNTADEVTEFRDSKDEDRRRDDEHSLGGDRRKDDPSMSSCDSSQSQDHFHDNHDEEAHGQHSHGHDHGHEHGYVHLQSEADEMNHHNMRSLILVMAISLHHIFEGLSVGLQHSVVALTTLMIAIMCHESIISFSVGMTFIKCKYTFKRHLLTAFFICLIIPIGEAIGTIMSEAGAESVELEITSGILMAFSAGTFIFVTFFEILQEEIDPHDTSIGKVFFVFVGFLTMACLMFIPEPPYEPPGTVHETTNATLNAAGAYMFTTLPMISF